MTDPRDSVVAWSGCRVDLAGGTLDIWPLGLLHPGAVTTNLAVEVEVRVTLERRSSGYRVRQHETAVEVATREELRQHPDGALVAVVAEAKGLGPVQVELSSASPRGGGLAASSALTICLLAAAERLLGEEAAEATTRAHLAQDLEARVLGLPTGSQDFYPPQLGGALAIEHCPGGPRVRRLEVDLEALEESLLVVHSGQSHFSAAQNWEVVRRRLDGDPSTKRLFSGLAALSTRVPTVLEGGDLEELGATLTEEWRLRRRLSAGISTPAIEAMLDRAEELGAWGGRACGAGGGGCLALLCPPGRREAIGAALVGLGGTVISARPSVAQLRVADA